MTLGERLPGTAPRLWLLAAWFFLPMAVGAARAGPAEQVTETAVGTLYLARPAEAPKGLVLFLPGARGWDPAASATARALAGQDHLVVGVDWRALAAAHPASTTPWWDPRPAVRGLTHWIASFWSPRVADESSDDCWDLGADLAWIADWVQAREALPKDAPPILVGQGEGAALAYVALLQTAPERFHAAATVDFCPRWPVGVPACHRQGLTDAEVDGDKLLPAPQVSSGWFLFDSGTNPGCPDFQPPEFARQVANARIASTAPPSPSPSPAAGPDDGEPSSPLESLFQWLDPRIHEQVSVVSAEAETAGLPLVEVRAAHDDGKTFAIMLSGDGGWAELDRAVSARLAERGISTVGWDSLSYFWKQRTPDDAGRDLARVIRHYLRAWHKERVILLGFSFGAEVLPFIANRLPPDLRSHVDLVALLSVGKTAMFQFHLSDWLNTGRGADALPIPPEVRALDWARRVCIYGQDDDESGCPDLAGIGVTVRKVPGDHHFNDDYAGVADRVLAERPDTDATPAAAVTR